MSKEKQIEEMSCKKCLHYEMCLENFRKAKEEGLWELTEEDEYFAHADECDFYAAGYRKQSEWISVEERLPKHLQKVLVCETEQKMVTATYISYGESKGDWCSAVRIVNKVTHWMPLPEAPKGGAE